MPRSVCAASFMICRDVLSDNVDANLLAAGFSDRNCPGFRLRADCVVDGATVRSAGMATHAKF